MPSRNVKGALAPVKRGHSVAINIAPDEGIPSPNNKEYLWDLRDLCDTQKKPSSLCDSRAPEKVAASYSPALHCSTIGASGLNFSVRNGKRWDPAAITT